MMGHRKTLGTFLVGTPQLSIRQHVWACGVLFVGWFFLAARLILVYVPPLMEWVDIPDSVLLQPLVGLATVFVFLHLLRLPMTLFVWLFPARCPKCDGATFSSWSASRYTCEDCGHYETTSVRFG